MELIILILVVISTAVLISIARKSTFGVKFFLILLSGYWILGYIAGPILFLFARTFELNSKFLDERLLFSAYDFRDAMLPILFGSVVFCITLILQLRVSRFNKKPALKTDDFLADSWIIPYALTTAFFAQLLEFTIYRNPVSKSLTGMLLPVFCAFIWKRKELKFSSTKILFIVLMGGTGTIILSIESAISKGTLILPLVVYVWTLPIWKEAKSNHRKFGYSLFFIYVTFQLFSLVQKVKLGKVADNLLKTNSDLFPLFFRPFLTLADRFDAFPRVVDSLYARGQLGGITSWVKYIVDSLIWNPVRGRDESSFGSVWNQLITEQSIRGSKASSVSLAQGMIGEGYIWSGFLSLTMTCVALAFIFVWIGRLIEKGLVSIIFAFTVVGNGSLFETGLVGFATLFSGAVKILLFLWISIQVHSIKR